MPRRKSGGRRRKKSDDELEEEFVREFLKLKECIEKTPPEQLEDMLLKIVSKLQPPPDDKED